MNKEILDYFNAKEQERKKQIKPVANNRGESAVFNTNAIKVINVDMSMHDSLAVYTLTDLHVGSEESEFEKAERYLNAIKDLPNAVVIVNGDLINNATIGSVSDTLSQSENIVPAIERVRKLLKEINDKNLAAVNVPGNHENRSAKLVAIEPSMLYGVKEENYAHAVYFLDIAYKTIEGKPANFRIAGSHGEMSKGTPGAAIDSLLKFGKRVFNGMPDLVVGGHVHQNALGRSVIFTPNYTGKSKTAKKLITVMSVPPVIAWEDYAAKKGYGPSNTDNSVLEVIATPDKDSRYINNINVFSLDRLFAEANMLDKDTKNSLKAFVNKLNRDEGKLRKRLEKADDAEIGRIYSDYLVTLFKNKKQIEKQNESKNLAKQAKEKPNANTAEQQTESKELSK